MPVPFFAHTNADPFSRAMTVIFKHMEKEEQVLFPMIESGQSDKVRFLISTLEDEHKEHSQYLLRIKEMTNNFTPPKEASSIWIALYKGLEDLEKEVEEHVNIEDNILFPRALNSLKP